MTKTSEAPRDAATTMASGWWNTGSFEPYFGAYAKWMRGLARLQQESVHFAQGRLQKNVEAATALVACRTPADMMEIQSRYAAEAMNDYAVEGRKFFDILKH